MLCRKLSVIGSAILPGRKFGGFVYDIHPGRKFRWTARAIHLGRLVPSEGSVGYVTCLDEAISGASRQGTGNTASCGGASLPR